MLRRTELILVYVGANFFGTEVSEGVQLVQTLSKYALCKI
jgi:hypothetical protein